MKNKILESFDEAVADIFDGASVLTVNWGPGGVTQNLVRALRDKGAKDLTLIVQSITPNYVGASPVPETEYVTPIVLGPQVKKLITTWATTKAWDIVSEFEKRVVAGKAEVELLPLGTWTERVRAGGSGIGGFYTQVGVGTLMEEGKEKRVIDGKEHIFEKPLRADFGFVRAHKADKFGNLVYRGSTRAQNPQVAMASDVVIAEVDEIVEMGELDPETIITPGIYVDRIVKIPPGGLGSQEMLGKLKKYYTIDAAKAHRVTRMK